MYGLADILNHPVRLFRHFPSLQHESPESQSVAGAAAFQDFRLVQRIPFGLPVAFPYAAVEAVIAADVGYLYQPSDVYPVPEPCQCRFPRRLLQFSADLSVVAHKQGPVLLRLKPSFIAQLSYQSFHAVCHIR